jgi:5-methyltetrahydrofolate--homocysteine methyltransferase
VTADHGFESLVAEFEAQHDDYGSIMAKSLAERLQQRVRTEFWGPVSAEALSNDDLIREHYQGIRHAPDYLACPDHSLNQPIFALTEEVKRAAMTLTETAAIPPRASMGRFSFWRPESRYSGVGSNIG